MEEKKNRPGSTARILRHPLLKAAALAVIGICFFTMILLIWKNGNNDLDAALMGSYEEDWEFKSMNTHMLRRLSEDAFFYDRDKELKNCLLVEKNANVLAYDIYMKWRENDKVGEPVVYEDRDGRICYYFYQETEKGKKNQNVSSADQEGTEFYEKENNDGNSYDVYDASGYDSEGNTIVYPGNDSEGNQIIYHYEYDNGGSAPAKLTDDKGMEQFLNDFPKLYPRLEKLVKAKAQKDYQSLQGEIGESVEKNGFVVAYSQNKSEKDTDLIMKFKQYPVYAIFYPDEDLIETSESLSIDENNNSWNELDMNSIIPEENRKTKGILFGIKSEVFHENKAEWLNAHKAGKELLVNLSICMALAGVAFLYLCFVTGRSSKDQEAHLYRFDKIWSEIILGGMVLAGVYSFAFMLLPFEGYHSSYIGSITMKQVKDSPFLWLVLACSVACVMVTVELVLSQLRHLKSRNYCNSFISIRLLKRAWRGLRKSLGAMHRLWKRGSTYRRAAILAVAVPLISMTWLGGFILIPILIVVSYRYISDFEAVFNGTEKIRNGDLEHKIEVKNKDAKLDILAENINKISQGLEHAVSSELRSERLKTELITNVSHDLKTPLTSIVTYVDLLKKETIENEKAWEYIDVIDRKTQRLTVLTNDLFDAAKASNGDMPVQMERVDLNAIIRQALGEYNERIEKAELMVRLNLSEQPIFVYADGRLTWRVLSNLLSNVCKYALTGSRVYIDVDDSQDVDISFTVKNVSAYELNIPADELMERFKRADESRNTEGNGLGLNIANSLLALQKGELLVEVDGDLFKVTGKLKKFRL